MPMVDKPIEELRSYQGRNPKPKDFDSFWDAGIAEMEALGTDCELIPAAFQVPGVECFDLYFTGVRGSRVHATYARPSNTDNCPVLAHFHGYSGKCMNFAWTAQLCCRWLCRSLDVLSWSRRPIRRSRQRWWHHSAWPHHSRPRQ